MPASRRTDERNRQCDGDGIVDAGLGLEQSDDLSCAHGGRETAAKTAAGSVGESTAPSSSACVQSSPISACAATVTAQRARGACDTEREHRRQLRSQCPSPLSKPPWSRITISATVPKTAMPSGRAAGCEPFQSSPRARPRAERPVAWEAQPASHRLQRQRRHRTGAGERAEQGEVVSAHAADLQDARAASTTERQTPPAPALMRRDMRSSLATSRSRTGADPRARTEPIRALRSSRRSLQRVSESLLNPGSIPVSTFDRRTGAQMGVIKRKRIWKEHAGMQQTDEALLQRALRFVDTRGVVLRSVEADLRAAIARHRAHPDARRRTARRGGPAGLQGCQEPRRRVTGPLD